MQKVVNDPLGRKRKGLLWLPLVAVPLLAFLFHVMGGGKGVAAGAAVAVVQGLNMTLPAAQFPVRGQPSDKMGYYAKAAQDSARLKERLKLDPYAAARAGDSAVRGGIAGKPGMSGVRGLGAAAADAQAERLLRRVGEMKVALRHREEVGSGGLNVSATGFAGQAGAEGRRMGSAEWERQAAWMRRGEVGQEAAPSLPALTRGVVASPPDPEMARIDGMLDKLIRVQHPEQVHRDSAVKGEEPVRVLVAAETKTANTGGFMEIGDGDTPDASDGGAGDAGISAVVNGDQTVVLGSGGGMTVELRLLQDVAVNGQVILANELVYGRASVAAGRLVVNVTAMRLGQVIVPVALQVYDLDGQPGIRINGSIAGDVSKEWADETLNGLGIASVDPSLGAQAATAGLQLAKSLAGHKVRQVPVSLPAGYEVLLKNVKH